MSMCCATRWRSTPSIRAGSTSEPPEVRSTLPPTAVIAGIRSFGIFPSYVGGGADPAVIRVVLPRHLRTLAGVTGEIEIPSDRAPTIKQLLDAIESGYPTLRGTIRDPATETRRPFIRFFACQVDLSHDPPDTVLPEAVATGAEPVYIVGAMAGG